MISITHKHYSLRKAIATATVRVSRPETIQAIRDRKIPKGDVLEFARAAALLAIKKTSDVIPDCHPLPVEFAAIRYGLQEQEIVIQTEVHAIYRTGVEVEAMHGATIAALTLYDMLKPVDPDIEISSVKLLSKEGGKSDRSQSASGITCAVVVCSDSVAVQTKEDSAGKAVVQQLEQHGLQAGFYGVIPDEPDVIQRTALQLENDGYRLVLFTGGTGLSPRDVTPEAIRPLLTREVPGLMEAARAYGQERTPYAMLSRGIAGFLNDTLVITLPGSTRGAVETMQALFPQVLHLFKVAKGFNHDQT
jgi:molybdenum cofactor biosynthesis protein MoaC